MKKINEKGITLVALVITIIVLLIIISITVSISGNQIKETKSRKIATELGIVEHALLETKTKIEYTGDDYPGSPVSSEELNTLTSKMGISNLLDEEHIENYYLLEEENLRKIGIENSEYKYIVNYKTGEVLNKDVPLDSFGNASYTYPGKQEDRSN